MWTASDEAASDREPHVKASSAAVCSALNRWAAEDTTVLTSARMLRTALAERAAPPGRVAAAMAAAAFQPALRRDAEPAAASTVAVMCMGGASPDGASAPATAPHGSVACSWRSSASRRGDSSAATAAGT